MKVCIYGAGAIGAHIGAHLARVEGVEVSLIARGPHLAAIQTDGLRVETESEQFTVNVKATDDPAALGAQDYVFVTLKSHQVADAVPGIVTLLGPKTAVIPPTTGIPYWYFHGLDGPWRDRRLSELDPDDRQWNQLGPERAIGCVFWTGAEVIEPGVVRQDGALSGYPIGEPDGTMSERITELSRVMKAGGLRSPVRNDIRAEIWMKMINSLVWNLVAFLTQASNGEIATSEAVVALVRRMMTEAEALAAALGVEIPVPMAKRIAMTLGAAGHRMSMLQDLERGRPVEIDALADSMSVMSELAGVGIPTIDALLSLAKLKGRLSGVYDNVS